MPKVRIDSFDLTEDESTNLKNTINSQFPGIQMKYHDKIDQLIVYIDE